MCRGKGLQWATLPLLCLALAVPHQVYAAAVHRAQGVDAATARLLGQEPIVVHAASSPAAADSDPGAYFAPDSWRPVSTGSWRELSPGSNIHAAAAIRYHANGSPDYATTHAGKRPWHHRKTRSSVLIGRDVTPHVITVPRRIRQKAKSHYNRTNRSRSLSNSLFNRSRENFYNKKSRVKIKWKDRSVKHRFKRSAEIFQNVMSMTVTNKTNANRDSRDDSEITWVPIALSTGKYDLNTNSSVVNLTVKTTNTIEKSNFNSLPIRQVNRNEYARSPSRVDGDIVEWLSHMNQSEPLYLPDDKSLSRSLDSDDKWLKVPEVTGSLPQPRSTFSSPAEQLPADVPLLVKGFVKSSHDDLMRPETMVVKYGSSPNNPHITNIYTTSPTIDGTVFGGYTERPTHQKPFRPFKPQFSSQVVTSAIVGVAEKPSYHGGNYNQARPPVDQTLIGTVIKPTYEAPFDDEPQYVPSQYFPPQPSVPQYEPPHNLPPIYQFPENSPPLYDPPVYQPPQFEPPSTETEHNPPVHEDDSEESLPPTPPNKPAGEWTLWSEHTTAGLPKPPYQLNPIYIFHPPATTASPPTIIVNAPQQPCQNMTVVVNPTITSTNVHNSQHDAPSYSPPNYKPPNYYPPNYRPPLYRPPASVVPTAITPPPSHDPPIDGDTQLQEQVVTDPPPLVEEEPLAPVEEPGLIPVNQNQDSSTTTTPAPTTTLVATDWGSYFLNTSSPLFWLFIVTPLVALTAGGLGVWGLLVPYTLWKRSASSSHSKKVVQYIEHQVATSTEKYESENHSPTKKRTRKPTVSRFSSRPGRGQSSRLSSYSYDRRRVRRRVSRVDYE